MTWPRRIRSIMNDACTILKACREDTDRLGVPITAVQVLV